MKNRKGQALVEFIIILPVLVYVLLVMIDIFVIYNKKSSLEGRMEEVVYLYKNNRSAEIKDYLNKDYIVLSQTLSGEIHHSFLLCAIIYIRINISQICRGELAVGAQS